MDAKKFLNSKKMNSYQDVEDRLWGKNNWTVISLSELMEEYAKEEIKSFIKWNNQHNGIQQPVPLKMCNRYLENKLIQKTKDRLL